MSLINRSELITSLVDLMADDEKLDFPEQAKGVASAIIETYSAPSVEAIPITDFYRMISNVQLDCDDDSGFSAEYRDGYSDGTRNAIIEMVQALCGDYDGDCDEFWEKFLKWDDRRRENGAGRCR